MPKRENTKIQRQDTIDNFVAQSKVFLSNLNLEEVFKHQKKEKQEKKQTFFVNGINYFQKELLFNREVEVLDDCVAIRGDHFYLKKGQVVSISSVICEYALVSHRGFKGYFPSSFFNLNYKLTF